MIKELAQFVYAVPDLVKERALEPKVGLHILICFDEKGNASAVSSERYFGKRHGETSNFLKKCAARQEVAWMIDSNKCLSKSKDIHSASPYCFGIKRGSWHGGEFFVLNKQKKPKPSIDDRIEDYFTQCSSQKYSLTEIQAQLAIQFKQFIKNKLQGILTEIEVMNDLAQEDYIIVYNEVDVSNYVVFNEKYTSEGLFNTADYNIELNGEILGTSNFFNGFNSKKPFLTHQTASFDITSRISAKEAKALADFKVYAGKKLLPNPLPIFIDKPELTNSAITKHLFHRSEDHTISHREIIAELLKEEEDLGNYYLLYFSGGAIRDFDFVAKFSYLLSSEKDEDGNPKAWVIENVTEVQKFISKKEQELIRPIYLTNVFDFEREVIGRLFDYKLASYNEKGSPSFKYFEDIESKWYRPVMFSLMLKYRKPVYDFIYKSMQPSLGWRQFKDICMAGIMDDIRNPDGNWDYQIKAKLNIYFSLYQYFDINENKSIMPSIIVVHKTRLMEVLENDDLHYHHEKDAELFAFGAGQLIYFLLDQSETSDKTHALLEPFLQKTTAKPFQDALINTFNKYKHKLGLRRKKLNKLLSETLGFPIKEGQLTELRATMLVGYFCPNIFYTKKTDSPT